MPRLERTTTLAPLHQATRALRAALNGMQKAWSIHVHLIRSNAVYEALVIALTELLLAQRINLQRLVTVLIWAFTSRWPRPAHA